MASSTAAAYTRRLILRDSQFSLPVDKAACGSSPLVGFASCVTIARGSVREELMGSRALGLLTVCLLIVGMMLCYSALTIGGIVP